MGNKQGVEQPPQGNLRDAMPMQGGSGSEGSRHNTPRQNNTTSPSSAAQTTNSKEIKDQIRRSLRKYLGGRNTKIESLSPEEFQTGLQITEDVGLRRLSNTPIGNRLYTVLKEEKKIVSEDEFVNTMATLYCGRAEDRFDLTMRVYDLDNSGEISRDELSRMLLDSWIECAAALGRKMEKRRALTGKELPTPEVLAKFEKNGREKLQDAITHDFDRFDTLRRNNFDRNSFKAWCQVDHTIVMKVGGEAVQVAVTFVDMEKPMQYPTL